MKSLKNMSSQIHRISVAIVFFAVLTVFFTFPTFAAKKPSKASVKNAYMKYIKRYQGTGDFGYEYYKMADLNKDGVMECIVEAQAGQNLHLVLLTYRGGKVRKFYDSYGVRGFNYNAAKKKLCIEISYGINQKEKYFIYKFNGKNLKQIGDYTLIINLSKSTIKYYQGSKRISEASFHKVTNPIFHKWGDLRGSTRF